MGHVYIHVDPDNINNSIKFGITRQSIDAIQNQYRRRVPNGYIAFFYSTPQYKLIEKRIKNRLIGIRALIKCERTGRFSETTTLSLKELLNIVIDEINKFDENTVDQNYRNIAPLEVIDKYVKELTYDKNKIPHNLFDLAFTKFVEVNKIIGKEYINDLKLKMRELQEYYVFMKKMEYEYASLYVANMPIEMIERKHKSKNIILIQKKKINDLENKIKEMEGNELIVLKNETSGYDGENKDDENSRHENNNNDENECENKEFEHESSTIVEQELQISGDNKEKETEKNNTTADQSDNDSIENKSSDIPCNECSAFYATNKRCKYYRKIDEYQKHSECMIYYHEIFNQENNYGDMRLLESQALNTDDELFFSKIKKIAHSGITVDAMKCGALKSLILIIHRDENSIFDDIISGKIIYYGNSLRDEVLTRYILSGDDIYLRFLNILPTDIKEKLFMCKVAFNYYTYEIVFNNIEYPKKYDDKIIFKKIVALYNAGIEICNQELFNYLFLINEIDTVNWIRNIKQPVFDFLTLAAQNNCIEFIKNEIKIVDSYKIASYSDYFLVALPPHKISDDDYITCVLGFYSITQKIDHLRDIVLKLCASGQCNKLQKLLDHKLLSKEDLNVGFMNEAATYGKLEIIKLLLANGCTWTTRCESIASRNQHWNCALYAVENGCEYSSVLINNLIRAIANVRVPYPEMLIFKFHHKIYHDLISELFTYKHYNYQNDNQTNVTVFQLIEKYRPEIILSGIRNIIENINRSSKINEIKITPLYEYINSKYVF